MILADHISPVRVILYRLCPCKCERGTVFQAHLLINRLILLWIIQSMDNGSFYHCLINMMSVNITLLCVITVIHGVLKLLLWQIS